MRLITIESKYNVLKVHEGKLPRARLVWQVYGQLEIWVTGSLSGVLYEQAGNLAINAAEGMNIPARMVRAARCGCGAKKSFETNTRRLL